MVKYFCDMCECEKKERELYNIKVERLECETGYRDFSRWGNYNYRSFDVCKKCRKKIMYMFKI